MPGGLQGSTRTSLTYLSAKTKPIRPIIKPVKNTLEITKKETHKTKINKKDIPNEINKLTALMKIASDSLDFEQAIVLRNEISELKKQLNKKD